MDEKLLKMLKKKAKGYTVTETVKEYSLDENGNEKQVKCKKTKKYYPPDMQALKVYMEISDLNNISEMSVEELEKEKKRLLAELASTCESCEEEE